MSYAPAAPMNRNAVISLVLGIVGGILPLIGNLLGVIFGHRALRQIRVSAERGRVLAIVGLILNYLSLLTYIGLGVVLLLLVLGIGGLNAANGGGAGTGIGANGTRDVSNTQTYSECAAAAGSDSSAMAQCVARFRTIEPSATAQ